MRPLAPSEKILFLILCAGVFLALNMIGLRAFLEARTRIEQSIVVAKSELAEDQNWLTVANTLHPAMTWINAHSFTGHTSEIKRGSGGKTIWTF